MKVLISTGIILFYALRGLTQQPAYRVDFEDAEGIITSQGISGKAFDLTSNSTSRYAMAINNPLKDHYADFSLTTWVKSPENSREDYVILSSLTSVGDSYQGWKISVQANGAWMFEVNVQDTRYEYKTTSPRQNIRDEAWHLVALTYESSKSELRFYFDGFLTAIYFAPGIEGFQTGKNIIIGNSLDSEYSRVTGEMTKPDFVLTEWDSFNGWIDDILIYPSRLDAEYIKSYYYSISQEIPSEHPEIIPHSYKVTAFNIWHGGNRFGKEVGKQRLMELLNKTNSDVYLIVETYGSGVEIADALGYYLYLISSNLSIISRYPIVNTYTVFDPFHCGGIQTLLPGGRKVNLFCTWLSSHPQYFIKGLTADEPWPIEEYLEAENKTRGTEIKAILDELQPFLEQADSVPLILGGDFNSGSHLDWVEKNTEVHNGYTIPWPASLAAEKAGLKDAFREIFPDPLKDPGITWSPIRNFPLKDRIDFIYFKGVPLTPVICEVINEHPKRFPSDHAGVYAEFKLIW